MATLSIQKREGVGKYVAFDMRKEGFIPGVIYGRELKENLNVKVPLKEFVRILHSGERVLDLDLEGTKIHSIIKDVQHGTFDRDILHADFRAISDTDKIHVTVEVALVGDSVGVAGGGVVEQSQFNVDVECTPKTLPDHINVDITNMNIDNVIYVKDIVAPAGVKILTHADVAVASCHMPAGEEVAAEEGAEGPEVIGAKKEE
ncbi:MAG: 50S ribosomal protein L25 [Planctomycetes bacterium]|nr:50S ribosomal protein L25 [Planctomycetota bacterium]